MASVFTLIPGSRSAFPPVMGFRGRPAELNLHAALLEVADKVLVGIARRDLPVGVIGDVVQRHMASIRVKYGDDLRFGIPIGDVIFDELELENRSREIAFECQSAVWRKQPRVKLSRRGGAKARGRRCAGRAAPSGREVTQRAKRPPPVCCRNQNFRSGAGVSRIHLTGATNLVRVSAFDPSEPFGFVGEIDRASTQGRRSLPSIAMAAGAPKPTIRRQRSERQPTLQLLFVAPSLGPVILINRVPVIRLSLDAQKKICRAP
jgi:hypothetical protein